MSLSHRKNNARAIVDPTVWESTEVGGAEGLAFQSEEAVRKSKVSSMRSSLFQKNAKKGNETSPHTQTFYHSLVFQQAADAQGIRVRFSFEDESSVNYCEFGKANKKTWPKDVLAFFHNAIRCEIKDLIIIMRALQTIGSKLTVGHFVNVRVWWQTCSALILDYLDMEVKILEPWIAIALDGQEDSLEDALTLFKAMPQYQEALRNALIHVAQAFEDVCDAGAEAGAKSHCSVGTANLKSLSQKTLMLMNSLDTFVVQVARYMFEQEKCFVPPLSNVYKSSKKDRELLLGKGVKHFMKKGRKGDFMLVLLTRWIDDEKVEKTIIKMIEECHNCDFNIIVSRYENGHGNLVNQLRMTAGI